MVVPQLSSVQAIQNNAQGALRETLSALTNLEQLLRSRNVGPKAITSVLPDVSASFPELHERLDAFYESALPSMKRCCVDELRAVVQSRTAELDKTLRSASRKKTLNAATRLKLESSVLLVVRELGGVLPLFELLADVGQPATVVDWLEALSLSRNGDQSNTPGATSATAVLLSENETVPARLLPRVALNLVRLSASLVYEGSRELRVAFSTATGGEQQLRIDAATASGPHVELLLPRVVESTQTCLTAVAHQLGIALQRTDSGVTLSWPAPAP